MPDKRSVGHAYNIDFLNVVFAASSLFVLVTTVWMVWDDYDREWKNYQRQFTRLELEVTRATLAQAEQEVDQARVAELTTQRQAAEQQLATRAAQVAEAESQLSEVDTELFIATQSYQTTKAIYDAERYDYEARREEIHAHDPAAEVEGEAEVTALYEEWLRLGLEVESVTATRDGLRQQIAAFREEVTAIADELSSLSGETERLAGRVADLEPSLINDYLLNLPLLDFMAPTITVRQVITPNIVDDVNFTRVPKMDRCETCHLAIDRVGFEEAEQPFRTHPNLDVYVGSASPHPDCHHRVHRLSRGHGAVHHLRRRLPYPGHGGADGAVGRGVSLGGVASLGLPDAADRDGRGVVREVPPGRGVRAGGRHPERFVWHV